MHFGFIPFEQYLQTLGALRSPRPAQIPDAQMLLNWHEQHQQMLLDLSVHWIQAYAPLVQNTPFALHAPSVLQALETAHRARLNAARQCAELLLKFEHISANEARRLHDALWEQMHAFLQQERSLFNHTPAAQR